MHSLSDRITLGWDEVFDCPIQYAAPNSGVGDKVSSYYTSLDDEDDVDNAIMQVKKEELSSTDEFTTPKKRKASSIKLRDSE
jgi:hypothetical protein